MRFPRKTFVLLLAAVPVLPAAAAAQRLEAHYASMGFETLARRSEGAAPGSFARESFARESYAGRDAAGVPNYVRRVFSAEERRLMKERFGIEDPSRLYLSDSTPRAHLNYDTERDPGAGRLVRTYRVGAPSLRRAGETWEAFEARLRTMRPSDLPRSAAVANRSLAALDSVARPHFERLFADARRLGYRVRIVETYRAPERQAWLQVQGGGLTFTGTSHHTAGRAVDVVIGDGNLKSRRTRAQWTAFRRWVASYDGGRFRLIGEPGRSWDWPHIELADGAQGFGSIEEMLEAARCSDPERGLHSSHDSSRCRAASVPRPRGGGDALRLHGAAGRAPAPAGGDGSGRGAAGGTAPALAGARDE